MKKITIIMILLCNVWNLIAIAHTEVKPQIGDGYVDIWLPIEGDGSKVETLLEEFSVRLTFIPKDDFMSKLEFGYKNGILPDLTFVDYSLMDLLLKNKVLQPIESYANGLDGIYRSRIISGAMDSNLYNDELYGLPVCFETEVLYYNKKLLPTPPALLTDWGAAGEQLFMEKGISIGSLELDEDYGSEMFNRYLSLYKTETIKELNTAYVDLFTQFSTIFKSNNPNVLKRDNSFERGLVAAVIQNRRYIEKLDRYFPELDYGMVTIPSVSEESSSNSDIRGINVVLNPYSEDIDLSWDVMKFITYDEVANRVMADYFGQLPTLLQAAEILEEYKVFIDQANVFSGSIEFRDYSKVLNDLYEGRLTPEEAANLFAPIPEEPEEPESL